MTGKDPYPNLWFPFTYYEDLLEYPPLEIERGQGVYLYDKDGKAYLDAVGSWWVSALGHRHPEICDAIIDQLGKIEHVMMAGIITPVARELSERIARFLPEGMNRVFYSDNGSTSVEVAMKVALQYAALRGENRTEFIGLSGAYHGDTLGTMAVGNVPSYHGLFHERFKAFHFTDPPYCYRCPMGKEKETCGAECMDSLDRLLEERGDTIAAVIFEPLVQGAVGMRMYPPKVLTRIYEACERHGILTIADEVATGFGRTGTTFASPQGKYTPDLLCMAKALTGGFLPLSATAVQERIFEEFKGSVGSARILNHGHTFTGNPLAAAAACAALEVFERDRVIADIGPRVERFQAGLARFADLDGVGDVRATGMMGALEIVDDPVTKAPFAAELRVTQRIYRHGLERGIILRPVGNVTYFVPALNITDDEMDEMFDKAYECIVAAVADARSATA